MSGGGGGKPEATPVSEGEKIQAKLAKDQYDYYSSTYAPLAKRRVNEASQDFSGRFAGQAGSAGMREATGTLRDVAMTGNTMDTTGLAGAITQARVGGQQQGLAERDQARLDALGVGLGATADATKSLSQAGAIQTDAAIQSVRDKMAEQEAKNQERNALIGGLASVGATYGTNKFLASRDAAADTQYKQAVNRYGTSTADSMRIQGTLSSVKPFSRSGVRGGYKGS